MTGYTDPVKDQTNGMVEWEQLGGRQLSCLNIVGQSKKSCRSF